MRNTHLLAIAPTVSNSVITGGISAGIEPLPANIYTFNGAKGTFIRKNKVLEVMLDTKGENKDFFGKIDDVFTKLNDLESKLASMNNIITKIDELGAKIEQVKEPTPQERLQMRSLDSYPFNQNPQEFFTQKQDQMRSSGKNEYILTKNDIENYSQETIRDTFNKDQYDDEFKF